MDVIAFDAPGALPIAGLPLSAQAPANVVVARWADRGYLTRGTDDPANTLYQFRLLSDIEIAQSVIDALAVGGVVSLTASEPELWNGDDALNAAHTEGRMDGRALRVLTVPVTDRAASDWGSPYANAVRVWQGRVTRVGPPATRVRVALSDITDRFGTQLQTALYDGAGGLGGAVELKGRPKPISLGNRFNVTPVYLGLVDLGLGMLPTFQSNWREIVAHDTVRIRGVVQERVGIAPAIGQWVDFALLGIFQLGSTPDGPVTCDVRGDAPGGQFAKTVPACVRVLLQALGPGLADGDFDDWSWFKVQPLLPAEIGWGIGADATTCDAALGELLASAGAWICGTRAGQVRIAMLQGPDAAPDFTLEAAHIREVEPLDLPLTLQPTPQVVEVAAARNWTPLDDIAGSVVDPERAALVSQGAVERALSSTIALRSTRARTLGVPGLYRYAADAQTRAQELKMWLERGLRVVRIETDRYLGQVELGMTGAITYPHYGLSGGWSGIVVGYRERVGARRLELTMIG